MSFLSLVPIYLVKHGDLLAPLAASLEKTFRLPVRTRRAWFDIELSYDPSREQYNSTHLLGQLLKSPFRGAERTLGVVAFDLFIPVLTYVFGEAQLDGVAALVSTYRLQNEAYGLPPDRELLFSRLEKESIHELGHTYGLYHCPDQACVMHSSTYAEQIDLKSGSFCMQCFDHLKRKRKRQ